jgi:hypothetical protein
MDCRARTFRFGLFLLVPHPSASDPVGRTILSVVQAADTHSVCQRVHIPMLFCTIVINFGKKGIRESLCNQTKKLIRGRPESVGPIRVY